MRIGKQSLYAITHFAVFIRKIYLLTLVQKVSFLILEPQLKNYSIDLKKKNRLFESLIIAKHFNEI